MSSCLWNFRRSCVNSNLDSFIWSSFFNCSSLWWKSGKSIASETWNLKKSRFFRDFKVQLSTEIWKNIHRIKVRDISMIFQFCYERSIVSRRGNYGYLLSHFFGKNCVKVMVLLKKLLNRWFDDFFSVSVKISEISSCYFPQKFRKINAKD